MAEENPYAQFLKIPEEVNPYGQFAVPQAIEPVPPVLAKGWARTVEKPIEPGFIGFARVPGVDGGPDAYKAPTGQYILGEDMPRALADAGLRDAVLATVPPEKHDAARKQWADAAAASSSHATGIEPHLRRIVTNYPGVGSWVDEGVAKTKEALGQGDYTNEVAFQRALNERASADPSWGAFAEKGAGLIGGAVALPVANVMKGAGALPAVVNTGLTAGGYSALEGAGAAEKNRLAAGAASGLIGTAVGGGLGLAANKAAPVVSWLGDKISSVIPKNAAKIKLRDAMLKDAQQGSTMSEADYAAASGKGQPVMNLDIGGDRVRRLARGAVDTSGEAEAVLSGASRNRVLEGAPAARIESALTNISGMKGNATATLEALDAAAKASRTPLYDAAYQQGANGITGNWLTPLMGAPAIKSAMGDATKRMMNREAVAASSGAKTTGIFPKGVNAKDPAAPRTLEFWDAVKQSLDDDISKAVRNEQNGVARELTMVKNRLVENLDKSVPRYASARGTAEHYFNTGNAVEAGEKFASAAGKYTNEGVKNAMSDMTSQELAAFKEGYISRLRAQVREARTTGERNVASELLNSTASRERSDMVLGPNLSAELRAFLDAESRMSKGHSALEGGPKTARYANVIANLGMPTGGGAAGYLYGGDPQSAMAGALVGAGLRGTSSVRGQAVADELARMLASRDISAITKSLPSAKQSSFIQGLDRFARGIKGLSPAISATQSTKPENETEAALRRRLSRQGAQ